MGRGETSGFFKKYCEDMKLTLKDPILQRLKALENAMAEELELGKGQKGRNLRFISNLYTNVLSCIVSLGRKGITYNQLNSEGWKLNQSRYSQPERDNEKKSGQI